MERENQKNEASCVVASGGHWLDVAGFDVTMPADSGFTRSESSTIPDLVAATSFGGKQIQRKKRMGRQRRSSLNVDLLPFAPSSSSPSASTSSAAAAAPHVPLSLPARVINPFTLTFLFQKQLQNSDVGPLRRMVLPKKAAETHLPVLEAKEGILIPMDDMDGLHVWSFKYRFWPNNNSRMYVLENTGDFVNTHGLQVGDYIMVYQDYVNLNYVIEAKKAYEQNVYTDHTAKAVDGSVPLDPDSSRSNQLWSWDYPQPQVEDTGMSYVYDTTFSNDFLLDYLNGSMTNYYYKPPDSFGSVDNLSFDDYKPE
ncbi:hypothetical protein Nepgr_026263 [Nepenthes gracilis]|uniref:TF-B3 domain-containing protein n=1 Tax=Nepenthes gracilis TaxID=150966 RepID=A0AAD3Y1V7_NEPGR|nr:hypothetical protein Nepgr_026263 [Nepenthes gracilis]